MGVAIEIDSFPSRWATWYSTASAWPSVGWVIIPDHVPSDRASWALDRDGCTKKPISPIANMTQMRCNLETSEGWWMVICYRCAGVSRPSAIWAISSARTHRRR